MSTKSPPERALPDLMVRQQNWDSGAEVSAYTGSPDRPASWVNIVNIADVKGMPSTGARCWRCSSSTIMVKSIKTP